MYSTRPVTDGHNRPWAGNDTIMVRMDKHTACHPGALQLNGSRSVIKAHKAHINLHLMYSTTSTTFSRELTHRLCPGTPGSPGGPGGP